MKIYIVVKEGTVVMATIDLEKANKKAQEVKHDMEMGGAIWPKVNIQTAELDNSNI